MMTNALTLRAHSIRHTTSDPATLATAVEAILAEAHRYLDSYDCVVVLPGPVGAVTGCTKISPGCKHCYAERMAKRLQAMGQPNYRHGFQSARNG